MCVFFLYTAHTYIHIVYIYFFFKKVRRSSPTTTRDTALTISFIGFCLFSPLAYTFLSLLFFLHTFFPLFFFFSPLIRLLSFSFIFCFLLKIYTEKTSRADFAFSRFILFNSFSLHPVAVVVTVFVAIAVAAVLEQFFSLSLSLYSSSIHSV